VRYDCFSSHQLVVARNLIRRTLFEDLYPYSVLSLYGLSGIDRIFIDALQPRSSRSENFIKIFKDVNSVLGVWGLGLSARTCRVPRLEGCLERTFE
jgi:hypothetical protein